MRIIHVCPRYYPHVGGVEVVVKNIAENMHKLGHEVIVFSTDPLIIKKQNRLINGVKSTVYPAFAPKEAYYLPSIKLSIDLSAEKADIVHFHSIHSLTFLSSLFINRFIKNTSLIISPYFHGKGHTKLADLLFVPYIPLIHSVFEHADGVIVNSNTQKNLICNVFGNISRIFTVYDGVNLDNLRSTKPLILNRDCKKILYVGRIEKYKNIHITIESLKNLEENYHFFIIGQGPYMSELKKQVSLLNLTERVHFLGYQPDSVMYQWMKTADVFVHLSAVESFGMTCIESLGAGTPVISNSDGLGLSETIQLYPKNIFAYNVKKEPISKLSELITKVVKSKPISVDVSMFSWDKITKSIIIAYNDILHNKEIRRNNI